MGDSGGHLTMFLLAEATQRATAAPPCSGQLMELWGVQDHSRAGTQDRRSFESGQSLSGRNSIQKYVKLKIAVLFDQRTGRVQ